MSATPPRGTYEAWVGRIREWMRDPTVSLEGLPHLSEASFSPATFARLLKHIERAIDQVMKQWSTSLQNSLQRARNDHEMEEALVHSRTVLYRRVQLSNHPGLPAKIREALMNNTRIAIQDVQQQLEKSAANNTSATNLDLAARDRLVMVFRRNPLTAVLSDNYHDASAIVSAVDTIAQQGNDASGASPADHY